MITTTLSSQINEELDFANICRVCCIEGKLMSIFKVHLFKKIMSIAEVNVSNLCRFGVIYLLCCYPLLLGLGKRWTAKPDLHEVRGQTAFVISVQKDV